MSSPDSSRQETFRLGSRTKAIMATHKPMAKAAARKTKQMWHSKTYFHILVKTSGHIEVKVDFLCFIYQNIHISECFLKEHIISRILYSEFHPFVSAYAGSGRGSSSINRETQTSPSPETWTSSSGGIPKGSQANRKTVPAACPVNSISILMFNLINAATTCCDCV